MAFPLVALAVLSLCHGMAEAAAAAPPPKLKWHYYNNTCRYVEEYVRHQVKLIWDHDKSLAPKLARLVYSDCFVTVCPAPYFLIYLGTSYFLGLRSSFSYALFCFSLML